MEKYRLLPSPSVNTSSGPGVTEQGEGVEIILIMDLKKVIEGPKKY